MTELHEMTKAQLLKHIQKLESTRKINDKREYELLSIIKNKSMNITQLANEMNTTNGNISTLLTYLLKAGHIIITDHKKNKVYLTYEQYKSIVKK